MNYFEQKVYNYIQTHGLIEPGNRLVVGVSGGADSVCLLRVLKALMPVLHIPSQGIVVVHVHHGIRGAEAEHDAAFTLQPSESPVYPAIRIPLWYRLPFDCLSVYGL